LIQRMVPTAGSRTGCDAAISLSRCAASSLSHRREDMKNIKKSSKTEYSNDPMLTKARLGCASGLANLFPRLRLSFALASGPSFAYNPSCHGRAANHWSSTPYNTGPEAVGRAGAAWGCGCLVYPVAWPTKCIVTREPAGPTAACHLIPWVLGKVHRLALAT
jgi:hypothetical protein